MHLSFLSYLYRERRIKRRQNNIYELRWRVPLSLHHSWQRCQHLLCSAAEETGRLNVRVMETACKHRGTEGACKASSTLATIFAENDLR